MPTIHIDQAAVDAGHVATVDTDGSEIDAPATLIPVILPDSDRAAWLAAYDPSEAYSPSAADSRQIARAVLEALRAFEGL